MPHQAHHISPLFSAGSNDHGTASVKLADLIDLASEYAQNHPASVAMLESLLSKCLDFHEARHPSMTPSIRHLANFLINAMKLSAPNEAVSPQVKVPNISDGQNPGSMRIDGWTQDEAKRALQKGLMGPEEYVIGKSENGLRGALGPTAFEPCDRDSLAGEALERLGPDSTYGHGLRGTSGSKTAYLLSPGIVHELSNGLERMSVNENDFKAVCVAVLSLSQRKLNQNSSSLQAVADMTGQGDSSEFSVREIDDEIEMLKTSEPIPQPSKKYVVIRLLRTFGFIAPPRPEDKRVYVSKWPESWDIWNEDPAVAVDKFWKRHLELNSTPRVDGLSVKVAKNRFLRGKIRSDEYVQHMSDYELAARIASFSSHTLVSGYTEDGPTIPFSRDQQVVALSKLITSDEL